MDMAEFKRTMDEWIRMLEATPPAKGQDRVLYPGRLEAEEEKKRAAEGIPQAAKLVWMQIDTNISAPRLCA